MKRLRILVVGLAFSAASALPICAAGGDQTVGEDLKGAAESTGHEIKKGAEATGHAVKEGAEATGHAVKEGAEKTGKFLGLTSSEAARYEANEQAQHRMYGQVTKINHASGVIDVKTAETSLQLLFPPKAVRDLNKGDAITVELGYAMADTAASEKAYDAPKEGAQKKGTELGNAHWVKGTVAEINHDSGIVSVKTENARVLALHFPSSDIANLNSGDHVAVEMGFKKGNHTEKAPTED